MIDVGIGLLAQALLAAAGLAAIALGARSWGADGRALRAGLAYRASVSVWVLWSLVIGLVGGIDADLGVLSSRLHATDMVIARVGWLIIWCAMVSGAMLTWQLSWAAVGALLAAVGELLAAIRPDRPSWPDPVQSAVALAVLVCLGRFWLGPG